MEEKDRKEERVTQLPTLHTSNSFGTVSLQRSRPLHVSESLRSSSRNEFYFPTRKKKIGKVPTIIVTDLVPTG